MAKCPKDDFMDSYLLGKMDDKARDEFEEHYFNCASCFAKMTERDKIIGLLRDEEVLGALAEYYVEISPRRRGWRRLFKVFRRR
jgi:anti-sigma factor RsiW